jgi:putative ABC transport system permease protein
MTAYYLRLALRSLRRNVALTVLMVVAIGFGIAACMTTATVFRAMAQDPIPDKSRQLFSVQLDIRGPADEDNGNPDHLDDQVSYLDAVALMQKGGSWRQTPLYGTQMALHPTDTKIKPFKSFTRAAYAVFFQMFEVPFRYGRPWSREDDDRHAPVAVISKRLNEKLFGGANSIGKTINLQDQTYTIVGVLDNYAPLPRFYDLDRSPFRMRDDVYVPFTSAVDTHLGSGHTGCNHEPKPGWANFLASDCTWLKFWVELPTVEQQQAYKSFLDGYLAQRFSWPPRAKLRDVGEWLAYRHVVPSEVNVLLFISVGFLLVCLLNATGLMLAKIMQRATDIGVRRALGARRGDVFAQCLVETGLVGIMGGVLGLMLTLIGLSATRAFLSEDFATTTQLHLTDTALTVSFAIIATMLAGLYPVWRATHVHPAWQVKAPV